MPQDFFPISPRALFDLENAKDLEISDELSDFLSKFQLPWLALGPAVTEFVVQCVDKVPAHLRHQGNISEKAFLENADKVVVEKGAVIEAGAYVVGPAYIAANATVRHSAYVRGSVYLGQGAVVGHTTEVKGSLLLPHAKASHFAYVGDSILGVNTNLGAGTKLANLRFDHGAVQVRFENTVFETALKKVGAFFGNNSQSGCNSVTNPGTILLPGAVILPAALARGVIRPRALKP